MKDFAIFFHRKYGFQAVKQGFSWPALLFAPAWAIYKRMWLYASFAIFISVALWYMQQQIGHTLSPTTNAICLLLRILIFIIFGIYGNQLYQNELLIKGYQHLRHIKAATPETAISQSVNINTAAIKATQRQAYANEKLELAKQSYLKREYKKAYDMFVEAEVDTTLDAMSQRIKHQALMRIKLGVGGRS